MQRKEVYDERMVMLVLPLSKVFPTTVEGETKKKKNIIVAILGWLFF